jgi:hypothetical protein
LDPELLFRLLAVAEGYTPAFLPKQADPAAGPVSFALTPHDLDKRDPALVLKGRVLDENGRPVSEAVVEPFGFGKGDGVQFGGLKGFDPLAVTNKKGEFRLGVPEKGVAVYVQVNAPFKAPRKFKKLAAGAKPHDLTLFEGVTVRGRLVMGGKPLAGVAVGASQKDRNAETFVGEFQAATDERGAFQLRNVPAEDALALYGLMSSLSAHGAVGARVVRTGKSGSVSDVGDLKVDVGHKLSGRVVLADGKPVPAGTRVLLSRQEAWDSAQAVIDKEGRFSFAGLPSETYSLTVNVKGYHLSPKNTSVDLLNSFRLLGVVRGDISGLRLLLDPGPEPRRQGRSDAKFYEEYRQRREAPLRGAPEERQRR